MNEQALKVRPPSVTRRTGTTGLLVLSMIGIGLIADSASASDLTKDQVARSAVAVQQAQQQIGQSESGATQLEAAKNSLAAAQAAMSKGDEQGAERHATRARLHAELAVAKSQSAAAQSAAAEVLASSKTLQQEVDRNQQIQR
jgi:hypothetical protein